MTLLDYLPVRIAMLFQRYRINAELEEELHSHILHRADDLERSGLDRALAERQARIEFGAREKFKEECHDTLGYGFFEILFLDLRFALRALRKVPAITIAAVATLALAIGANSTVFGILDALILRPLNVPQAEDLYGTQYGESSEFQSYPNYVDLRDHNHSFEDLAAYNFLFVGIDTGKAASVATGYQTTGNYFDVLRIKPYLGRFFHSSDERGPNSAPFLVMSYAYWHSQFQGDPELIGRVVQLDKHPFHRHRCRAEGIPRHSFVHLSRCVCADRKSGAARWRLGTQRTRKQPCHIRSIRAPQARGDSYRCWLRCKYIRRDSRKDLPERS
jgi:MacB-like periplasmic core domain